MRIPVGDRLPRLDDVRVVHRDGGAVRNLVALTLAAELVHHAQFAGARHRDQVPSLVAYRLDVVQANRALALHFDAVGRSRPRSRAADVEGAHGQLRARLADRLRGDDADRLAHVDAMPAPQIAAIALRANAVAGFAGDGRTHHDLIDAHLFQELDQFFVDQDAGLDQHLAARGDHHILGYHAAQHALAQAFNHIAAFDDRGDGQAVDRAAVDLGDHQVLRHVDQATGQVAGVRRLQRGVGQAFTRAVSRDEVLQYVQAFAEIRRDGRFDDRAVRLRHEAAHAGQLANLRGGTASARVGHHEDRIERLLTNLVALGIGDLVGPQLLHHGLGHLIVGARPDVDHLVVALAVGDQTRGVLLLDLLHLFFGGREDLDLRLRHNHVIDADRHACARRVLEAGVHELIGEHDRFLETHGAVARVDRSGNDLLGHVLVDGIERQTLRQDLGQQGAAGGGIDHAHVLDQLAAGIADVLDETHFDLRLQIDIAALVGTMHFGDVAERHALALGAHALAGHVVQAQHHVLRRNDDGIAVGGRKDVVGRHHQRARFQLRLDGQRHVHGHLVAVEVGVERGADQRMQLDGLAFDQHGLESLNAEAMQGRRAIQQHRMFADHFFEDVPHFRSFALHQALRRLDGRGFAAQLQLGENERLEQLQRHFLRQSALMQAQASDPPR